MKIHVIIAALFFLCILSCDKAKKQNEKKVETPKALENEDLSEISYSRGNGDLLENLYQELSDKNPELKLLEKKIADINKSKSDSLELFNNSNDKINSYYTSANSHAERMNDSLLKNQMKSLIEKSLSKYQSGVSTHTTLIKDIDIKSVKLNELHIMLKLIRTLPMIEKYAIYKQSSTKPLEGYSKELDRVIRKMDTLIKQ